MKTAAKDNNTVSAVVAITIILVLAASTYLYYYFSPEFVSILPDTKMVGVPEISTHITDDDGEPLAVDANIVFEFTEYVPNVNNHQLWLLAEEAIASLDYDKLRQPGAVSYIQDAVRTKISEYISREDIVGIYISELQSGEVRVASPPPVNSSDVPRERDDVAKKLFNGLKK